MKDVYIYPAILSLEQDGVSVKFPDLPGCLTCGDPIPEPTPIPAIRPNPGQVPVLIDIWMPAVRDEMANRSVDKTHPTEAAE